MKGFPGSSEAKRLPVMRKSWVRSMGHEDPLEEEPTPVFLPGKFHGRRSLIGYSLWGRKQSQMTERLHFHFLSCFDRSLVAIKIHTRRVIFASKLMSVLSTWTIKLLTKCGRQNNGSLNMSLSKFLKMVKMLSYMAKGTIQVPRM